MSAPVIGWRLAQPRVTLLASAYFIEWSLPTYTLAEASNNSSSSNPTKPFTPPAAVIIFTVEWKAASSLESTKLDYRGDPDESQRNCLIPIEWSDEDVVLRLSFRFTEPVALPDGSKTPTQTIFDGERCIIRARRAEPMPLLRTAMQERELARAGLPPNASVCASQILKAHPALVDAFTLSTVRRANDTTLLEAGPWLGSRRALGLDEDGSGGGGGENSDDAHFEEQRKRECESYPVTSKRYEGCAVLNGVKFDVWEVNYKRTSREQKINFGFFGSSSSSSNSNSNNKREGSAERDTATTTTAAAAASSSSSPQPKAPVVSSHAAPATRPAATQQSNKNKSSGVSSVTAENVATTAALMSSEDPASPAMTATFSPAGSPQASAAAEFGEKSGDGEANNNFPAEEPGDELARADDGAEEEVGTMEEEAGGSPVAADPEVDGGAAEDSSSHSHPEPSQPLSETAVPVGKNSSNNSKAAAAALAEQEQQQDEYLGEDTIIFLAAHDGLDDVNMFENRKLTERLNPVNVLRCVFDEWLNRDNLAIVVCGSFTNGGHAISTTEHLIRHWEHTLSKQTAAAAAAVPTVMRDPCGYTRPRILCATFAANPPRLSVADASGRLKRKEVPVIRAQNHFLHVAPIIEAPVVAPDDMNSVEASANARRSRSLDFIDYFLGECASFAMAPDRTSIVLESYLERQNCYDNHAVQMTSAGSGGGSDTLNPVFAVANAAAAAANISTSHNSESAAAASFESPFTRMVMEETTSSSSFTPLDLVGNLPELTRERSLLGRGLPDHLSSSLSAPTLLSAFDASLQLHLVAAATEETVADAYPRCEPVITHAEIKTTRLRLAELTLNVEGSNLAFPRHVVLRDAAISRDVVFPRTEVEVEVRERSKGAFDGFTCRVHPAALLRFLNYDATLQPSNSELAAAAAARMGGGDALLDGSGGGSSCSGSNLLRSNGSFSSVINTSFRPGSPPRHSIRRLCAKFDVCLWADNGCAAFTDVVAPLPEAILPWMPGSGSWTSQQSAFVAPPVELLTNAVRLHAWGSFSSSQAGAPCPGTDMPRRLMKGFESAAVAIAAVAPQDGGGNFFSRALRSAKGKLATDPLTMSNAPSVPSSLKLQTTDALLRDVPAAAAGMAPAARAKALLQSQGSPKALRTYLEPLMQAMAWVQNGTDYADRVLRAAHLVSIPLQRGWFAGSSGAAPGSVGAAQRSSQAATPVVEALLWHHVVTLLAAGGTRITESVTEITLKSFVESIGHLVIKHESYHNKKESDGEAFFIDIVSIYTVCLVHELRALSTGTTLVICTGEARAGTTSIANTVQTAAPAIRHPTLPLAFIWVVDLHPLPDVVADALALFPNVALLFVETLDTCLAGRDTEVMRLSSTTDSIIRAQRTQGDPSEEKSYCRHQQWLVLNKIDAVAVPPNIIADAQKPTSPVSASSSPGNSPTKQGQLAAQRAVEARVSFIRDKFESGACPALRSWNAADSMLCVATDPESGSGGGSGNSGGNGVSQSEISELRVQALEVLQLAVRQIAVW